MWIHKTGYLTQLRVSSYSEKLKQKIFLMSLRRPMMRAIHLISGLQKQ